ncbi:MAG: hypothetical protein WBF58_09730 [Xanthobacteraceae bacterium]
MSIHTATEPNVRRAQTAYAGERGEQWVKHYGDELKRLPRGTHVAINCATGEYVLGPTSLEAIEAYARRFGKNEPGYMIEMGGVAFGGWGGGIV